MLISETINSANHQLLFYGLFSFVYNLTDRVSNGKVIALSTKYGIESSSSRTKRSRDKKCDQNHQEEHNCLGD